MIGVLGISEEKWEGLRDAVVGSMESEEYTWIDRTACVCTP